MNPKGIENLIKTTSGSQLDGACEYSERVRDEVYTNARAGGLSIEDATRVAVEESDLALHLYLNGVRPQKNPNRVYYA